MGSAPTRPGAAAGYDPFGIPLLVKSEQILLILLCDGVWGQCPQQGLGDGVPIMDASQILLYLQAEASAKRVSLPFGKASACLTKEEKYTIINLTMILQDMHGKKG